MPLRSSTWKEERLQAILSVLQEIEKERNLKIVQKRHYFSLWKGSIQRKSNFLLGIHVFDDYFEIITSDGHEFQVKNVEELTFLVKKFIK